MITTIIFDAEGIVFDTESIWDQAQVDFLGRRNVTYEREVLKPLLSGRSLIEGVRTMQSLYGFPGEPELLAQERLSIVKNFLVSGVNFIDGFLDFYRCVHQYYKVCIATAMDRSLFEIVEITLNLKRIFREKIFLSVT